MYGVGGEEEGSKAGVRTSSYTVLCFVSRLLRDWDERERPRLAVTFSGACFCVSSLLGSVGLDFSASSCFKLLKITFVIYG